MPVFAFRKEHTMHLYIVRHGQPIYSPKEQLTDLGHKQARALAPRLIEAGINKIYSSPLRRARQTAEPTANELGIPINIEPWMSEDVTWRRFTQKFPDGKTRWVWEWDACSEFVRGANHDAGDEWWNIEPFKAMENGREGYAQLQAESDEFLARLGYVREGNEYRIERPNHDRVAVFCHQGFGLTWLSHLLRIPPNIFWISFDLSHSGVTVLEWRNRKSGYTVPKVWCLSDLSHVFADDNQEYRYHSNIRF